MLHDIINYIVQIVGDLGYFGILFMMFLESSFFPFPSEVVMIPAGYLASKGELNLYIVLFLGLIGSILGALLNYFIAIKFGRIIIIKYGKYFFLNEESLNKIEVFFIKHGEISTFTGRLIPGLRQYISFPAGLAKMNLIKFVFFTSLGAFIWIMVLTMLGYFLGDNESLIKEYLPNILYTTLASVAILICVYVFFKIKKIKKL